ncbi:iron ABC transporter permease [Halobacteriovorax sp. HLS]|uniref:FecCD family ABC transporter permease n=1 Tax=Halobacteriovorax sp. HLS TaxID=2234000 RepID=UPI000FD99B13|nr:iron ABC transporter permease [Halobacteriovorax sp. HLS]
MKIKLLILSLVTMLVFILSIAIGPGEIQFGTQMFNEVILNIRLPRVFTAFMVGGILSLSGLLFQAMFRNSLATPYTLGVASGASLGAAFYLVLGLSYTYTFFNGVTLFSFLGALSCVAFVYGLARTRGRVETHTLLLSGIVISMLCSSLILFIQFLGHERDALLMVRWLMGGLDVVGYSAPIRLAPFAVAALIFSITKASQLNILFLGDDLAISRGVDVTKLRRSLYFLNSLIIAAVVAECGPIGFIGLVGPHISKKIFSSKHQELIPSTFVLGGCLLMLCDLIARNIMSETQLPVGVMTALLGGPFFLYLLLVRKK